MTSPIQANPVNPGEEQIGDTHQNSHQDGVTDNPQDEVQALLAERDAARAEAAGFKDEFLRAKAETENMRRRATEDVQKAHKYAIESFAESLLPVKDSLEMALATQNATPEQVLEGVHATLRQLAAAFERNKLLEIAPTAGEKFDPHKHQAIASIPAEQEANTVVGLMQKGYQIADRTLRPALVTVAAPK